ncbi:MAG TPA: hypothetical protein VLL52_22105 [Anaerolineae bacterium]|nr:hypothetical protein [Anaerolineae bacterium]
MKLWRWWQQLQAHPLYLREKGEWGNPNPYYTRFTNLMPFFVLAGLVFSFCGAGTNTLLFESDDALWWTWCIIFLPILVKNIILLNATILAPVLTAPTISHEINRGTWDILRLTPQPTFFIVIAKLIGSLGRLSFMTTLLLINIFEAIIMSLIGFFISSPTITITIGIIFGATSIIFRPFLEILFIALIGLILSTFLRSANTAIATSYILWICFKLANNIILWSGIFYDVLPTPSYFLSLTFTSTNYLIIIIILLAILYWRSYRLDTGYDWHLWG